MGLYILPWVVTFAWLARGFRPEKSDTIGGVSVDVGAHFGVRHGEPSANKTVGPAQALTREKVNVCDRAQLLREKKVPLEKALEGVKLTAVTRRGAHNWIAENPKTGKWSGFDYELLKYLASKGNFEFEIVNQDLTDDQQKKPQGSIEWLTETVKVYDINLEYRSLSQKREAQLTTVLYPWLDSSIVLVAQGQEILSFSFTLLLAPYDKYTWIVFLCTCALTCCAYLFVESRLTKDDEVDEDKASFLGSLYFALMQLATVSSLTPRTYTGKLIAVSWSLVAIIFMAGYTADLAACLSEVKNAGLKWHSIDDVIAAGGRICVFPGPSEEYMQKNFPSYDKVVLFSETSPIKNLVVHQACDVALATKNAFQVALGKQEVNPECKLRQVGPDLKTNLAGWTISLDFGDKCSFVIQAALHLLLEGMWEDGVLDRMQKDILFKDEQTREKTCSESAISDAHDSVSLPWQSMAGLFLLHFSVVACAVACMLPWHSTSSEPSTPAASEST